MSGDSGFVAKVSYEENTEAGKAAAAFWEPKNSPFVHKPGMLSMKYKSYQAPTVLVFWVRIWEMAPISGKFRLFGPKSSNNFLRASELCPGFKIHLARV